MSRNETCCPECEYRLNLRGYPYLGQKVRCSRCEANLIVTNLEPIDLDVLLAASRPVNFKKKGPLVEVPCSECDQSIKLSMHARLGHQLVCDACGVLLEVVNTKPLQVEQSMVLNLKQSGRGWRSNPNIF